MAVFDDIDRPDGDAHPHGECDFSYTNRSGRPEAKKVRELIEDWLTRYPEGHRPALIQRLRSPIDGTHRSAFLELLLHELFVKRGHEVIEVEPDVPGTSTQPDFLMKTPAGERYYLEAVLARGLSDDQVGAERRLNAALQAVDSTPSPSHFLDLRTEGFPKTPVPINKLRRAVADWIAGLPDGAAAKSAAPFRYDYDGMVIFLTAWPRHNKTRVTRSIGARHFGASRVMRAVGMKEAVDYKGKKYGKGLPHPLLVAVAGYDHFSFDDDALDALLGTEVVQTHKGADGKMVTNLARKPDGVWQDKHGPRRRTLSGVLWFKQIDPWNFASRAPVIVSNPWATHPMPRLEVGLREIHILEGEVTDHPGASLGAAIGLEDNWPE